MLVIYLICNLNIGVLCHQHHILQEAQLPQSVAELHCGWVGVTSTKIPHLGKEVLQCIK